LTKKGNGMSDEENSLNPGKIVSNFFWLMMKKDMSMFWQTD